jgi:hypothetical protein
MTSQQFEQYVKHQEVFRVLNRNFDPLEIYLHGSLAQSEILRETEILTDLASVTFTAGQAMYTSVDSGWEFLAKTLRIIDGVNSSLQPITVRSKTWVDQVRYDNILRAAAEPALPIVVYHVLTAPISLGFYGTPLTALPATLQYVRVAGPADEISSTVHPIIPDQWKELLIVGTTLKILDGEAFRDIKGVGRGKMYENLMAALARADVRYAALKHSARVQRAGLAGKDATVYRRFKI